MSLNNSTLAVIYNTPSRLIHGVTLLVTVGYGIYHVRFGNHLIGLLALASSVFCLLAIVQLLRRQPLSIHYYGVIICQIFALLLTCYYFGVRGLVLVTPFVAGIFFLFPLRAALWVSCIFVVMALVAAFPALETTLYIRLAIAQIISLFFTIAFSHVVARQHKLLEKEAYYDYLTDVLNRRGFISWLKHELAEKKKHNSDLALFYLDLDRFKAVNDTYGHTIGDELLVAFANRLLSALRSGDLIRDNLEVCNFARLSGDEFALAITDLHSRESAERIANRILQAISQPFQLGKIEIHITISLGICFASQCAFDESELFRRADAAMYESKTAGRNQAHFDGGGE